MEAFEFVTLSHEEYISRKSAIKAALPSHQWAKKWAEVNADAKQSPEMSKKGKAKQMKSPPGPPPEFDLPESAVKPAMGITEAVFQFLEVCSVASHRPTLTPRPQVLTTHRSPKS